MNDNLHHKSRRRGERKRKRQKIERKAAKLWEAENKKKKGEVAGLCNRWSERSLTAGEYARLTQLDKWFSCSQTAGRQRRKTVFYLQSNSVGEKLLFWSEKSMITTETAVNNIRFTQHKSTRETVLNTSKHTHTHTGDRKRQSEGETGKNKDK